MINTNIRVMKKISGC